MYVPAGGSNEALIATPTKLEVESSRTLKATPNPLKKATGNPAKNVSLVARLTLEGSVDRTH